MIFHDLNPANGISKKIGYQLDALRANGVDTQLCTYVVDENGSRKRLIDNHLVITDYGDGTLAKLKARFDYRELCDYICRQQMDFVYMRSFHNATPFLTALLRNLRKNGIRVVMEIPTYPYDAEYRGFSKAARIEHGIDRLFRGSMARELFRIVTFSDHTAIFDVRTIRISNGIDFDRIKLKRPTPFNGEELHLIGVAEVHYWHGYDRVLRGLADYYRTQPQVRVVFHLVGGIGPPEEARLHPLIEQNKLQPYVVCHGQLDGQALDTLFDQAHFGIASLGRHRSGITNIKTLKNREYAARGIPFVYSETDDDFETRPYVLKAPANETPLCIDTLIDFFRSQTWNPEEIRQSISNLSWKQQMKRIIDEITIENNNR